MISWDTELENIGLASNMNFSEFSEFGDVIHRLQTPKKNVRYCIFSVDNNYYIIKQELVSENDWCELWTKQMDKDLLEAKKYCEKDYSEHEFKIWRNML